VVASPEALPARSAWYEGRVTSWLTTTDHKRLGVLFVGTALLAGVVELVVWFVMRADTGPLTASREVFTLHLAAFVFVVLVPVTNGLALFVAPLQVGARGDAWPRGAAVGYWLYALGTLTLLIAFFQGGTGDCGWSCGTPLSDLGSGGHTGDFWLVALLLLGAAAVFVGTDLVATLRAPLAPFARGAKTFGGAMIVAAGAVVVVSALLLLARHGHLDLGAGTVRGLSWALGYPEVVLLLFAALAIVTEILRLGGRPAAATLLALGFWLTLVLGAGALLLPEHQLSGWRFFLAVGIYGLVSAEVLALLAGLTYWWPKAFGRLLDENLAVTASLFSMIGLNVAFFPAYAAAARPVYVYPHYSSWSPYATLSIVGAGAFAFGVALLAFDVLRVHGLRRGTRAGSDPWEGDTLEWYTTSPPPPGNFTSVPAIVSARPLRDLRERLRERREL
jgi:heme/copper-type cytochrome/quinol oxidase subunit 1